MNRSKRTVLTMVALLCAAATNFGDTLADDAGLLDVANLRIRDPFVVTDIANGRYVMVASMSNRQRGAKGWECYTSKDLRHWQAPVTVFTPPARFWADRDFWRRRFTPTAASSTCLGPSVRIASIAARRCSSRTIRWGLSRFTRTELPRHMIGWPWMVRCTSRTASPGWCSATNGSRSPMAR